MSLTLHTLKPSRGSTTRRFRVGRGNASGSGTTAGRGTKGQRARTGGRNRLKLKGMKQMLLRIPKNRGFNSQIAHPTGVTLAQLERWCQVGERVTTESLQKRNLIPANSIGIKVLVSKEKLTKKLILVGATASEEARKAVEAAGGSFEKAEEKKKKVVEVKKVAKKTSKK